MKDKKSVFDQMVKVDWGKLWPQLTVMQQYEVDCDDGQGILVVTPALDGDLHVWLDEHERADSIGDKSYRARTFAGGGRNERVRKALLMLALAIKEDADPEIGDTPF